MTRFEVDRACGQSPCLCGDIETWHLSCFAGKTAAEIERLYVRAYRVARLRLQRRAQQHLDRVLARIKGGVNG